MLRSLQKRVPKTPTGKKYIPRIIICFPFHNPLREKKNVPRQQKSNAIQLKYISIPTELNEKTIFSDNNKQINSHILTVVVVVDVVVHYCTNHGICVLLRHKKTLHKICLYIEKIDNSQNERHRYPYVIISSLYLS